MPLVIALTSLLSLVLASAPAPSPSDLSRLLAEKNLGLAALEEGNLADAKKRFEAVRRLAPAEPLGWADGAVAANPKDVASRWAAARLAAEEPGNRPRAIREIEGALGEAPANLFLLARLCELRRLEADRAAALSACDRMAGWIEGKDAKLEKYLAEARAALEAGDASGSSLKYRIVENILRAAPRFQQARHDVEPGVVGLPLEVWSPALAAWLRARPRPIPVKFVE